MVARQKQHTLHLHTRHWCRLHDSIQEPLQFAAALPDSTVGTQQRQQQTPLSMLPKVQKSVSGCLTRCASYLQVCIIPCKCLQICHSCILHRTQFWCQHISHCRRCDMLHHLPHKQVAGDVLCICTDFFVTDRPYASPQARYHRLPHKHCRRSCCPHHTQGRR
jgi:hypothetical protein